MNNISKGLALACLGLALAGCSDAKEEPTGIIPEGHLKAMDKAKGVENVLQDAQTKKLEDIDTEG